MNVDPSTREIIKCKALLSSAAFVISDTRPDDYPAFKEALAGASAMLDKMLLETINGIIEAGGHYEWTSGNPNHQHQPNY